MIILWLFAKKQERIVEQKRSGTFKTSNITSSENVNFGT